MIVLVLIGSLLSLSLAQVLAAPSRSPSPSPSPSPSAPVCALQGASAANLVKSRDSPNSYQLNFQWTRDAPVDYVDYHYRVNSDDFVNVRAYDGSAPAHEATHDLQLSAGDVLHAMLTYSVNGVGCDVAITETTAPSVRIRTRAPSAAVEPQTPSHTSAASPIPAAAPAPALPHLSCDHVIQQLVHDNHISGYDIYATLVPNAQWVDAHYTVGSAQELNIRLVPTTTHNVMALPEPIHAAAGTYISYYLTFGSSTAQACDSGRFETGDTAIPREAAVAPAPAAANTAQQPAQPDTIPLTQTPIAADAPVQAVAAAAAAAAAAPPPAAVTDNGAAAFGEPPCAAGNIVHQVASDGERNFVINFSTSLGDAPFDAVEVYTLVGNDEKTTPMGTNIATGSTPPIHVGEGESLIYYITYSRGGMECKTAFFST